MATVRYRDGMTTQLADLVSSLPAIDAPHTCTATRDLQCYVGQWTVHGPHDQTLRSGTVAHCPGKTAETVLGR